MDRYIFASVGFWHKKIYREKIRNLPGRWTFIEKPKELTLRRIKALKPRYIFFPHWRWKVLDAIVNCYDCICFHETNLPFGRGGSPIQNLICRGYRNTVICAIKMIPQLDAGPIYMKRKLSLKGSVQDIYTRSSKIMYEMIKEIINKNINPKPQKGKPVFFRRRRPKQSKIPRAIKTLRELYDFIRMLDCPGYPQAFITYGIFKIEFLRAQLKKRDLNVIANISLNKERGKR